MKLDGYYKEVDIGNYADTDGLKDQLGYLGLSKHYRPQFNKMLLPISEAEFLLTIKTDNKIKEIH